MTLREELLGAKQRAKQGLTSSSGQNEFAAARQRVEQSELTKQGLTEQPTQPIQPVQPQPVQEKEGWGARLTKDVGVTAAKSIIGLGEAAVGLANIPTFGVVGKILEEATGYDPEKSKELLSSFYTPEQKQAQAKVDKAKGFVDTTIAAVQSPSTIVHAVGESIPMMFGGAAIGRSLIKVAPKLAGWLAASIGEGTMGAGSAAESTRQKTESGMLSAKQVATSVASGVGTGLFNVIGSRFAQKMGIADIDTLLVSGRNSTGKNIAKHIAQDANTVTKRLLAGGISEGVLEEMPQSTQEQIWSNAALDKPLMDGVPEAAAMGMLTGAAMGAGANIRGPKQAEQTEEAIRLSATQKLKAANITDEKLKFFLSDPDALKSVNLLPADVIGIINTRSKDLNEARDFMAQVANAPSAVREGMINTLQGEVSKKIIETDRLRTEEKIVKKVVDEPVFKTPIEDIPGSMPDATPENKMASSIAAVKTLKTVEDVDTFTANIEPFFKKNPELVEFKQQMLDTLATQRDKLGLPAAKPAQPLTGKTAAPVVTPAEPAVAAPTKGKPVKTAQKPAAATEPSPAGVTTPSPEYVEDIGKDLDMRLTGTKLSSAQQLVVDHMRIGNKVPVFQNKKGQQPEVEVNGKILKLNAKSFEALERKGVLEKDTDGNWQVKLSQAMINRRADIIKKSAKGATPVPAQDAIVPASEGAPGATPSPGAPTRVEATEATVGEVKEAVAVTETEITPRQAETGKYKKAPLVVQGINIRIENPDASIRSEKPPKDAPTDWEPSWSTKMSGHYGYIERTEGADKDPVDVFVGTNPKKSDKVYIIDQNNKEGKFDEHKVIMGVRSEDDARKLYLSNYEKGWTGLGAVTEMTSQEFKTWLKEGSQKKALGTKPVLRKKVKPQPVIDKPTEKAPSKSAIELLRAAAAEVKAKKPKKQVVSFGDFDIEEFASEREGDYTTDDEVRDLYDELTGSDYTSLTSKEKQAVDAMKALPEDERNRLLGVKTAGLKASEVKETIEFIFGKKLDSWLIVVDRASQLPKKIRDEQGITKENILYDRAGKIRGVYDNGKLYLVADAIPSRRHIPGLLAHEGGHLLRRADGWFQKQFNKILTDFEELAKTDEQAKKAMDFAKKANPDLPKELVREEGLMYFIQSSLDNMKPKTTASKGFKKLWEQLKDLMSRAIYKHFKTSAKTLGITGEDLGMMVISDLRKRTKVSSDSTKSLAMYAGEKALTTNLAKLTDAQNLVNDLGDSPEIMSMIRQDTGWYMGEDNKWRFEIDDSMMKWKVDFAKLKEWKSFTTEGKYKLKDIIEHPWLFRAYPELLNTTVFKSPMLDANGSYNPNTRVIKVSSYLNPAQARMTLAHEIQHWIQHKERFAKGDNTDLVDVEKAIPGVEKHYGDIVRNPGPHGTQVIKGAEEILKAAETFKQQKIKIEELKKHRSELEDDQDLEIQVTMKIIIKSEKAIEALKKKIPEEAPAVHTIDLMRDKQRIIKELKKLATAETISYPEYNRRKANVTKDFNTRIKEAKEGRQTLTQEDKDIIALLTQLEYELKVAQNDIDEIPNRYNEKIEDIEAKLIYLAENSYIIREAAYTLSHGEAEARDVSRRLGLDEEGRRQVAPFALEGIDPRNTFLEFNPSHLDFMQPSDADMKSLLDNRQKTSMASIGGLTSRLEEEVIMKHKGFDSAKASAWRKALDKKQIPKGMKEELFYSNILEWLDDQGDTKISKAEIISQMKSSALVNDVFETQDTATYVGEVRNETAIINQVQARQDNPGHFDESFLTSLEKYPNKSLIQIQEILNQKETATQEKLFKSLAKVGVNPADVDFFMDEFFFQYQFEDRDLSDIMQEYSETNTGDLANTTNSISEKIVDTAVEGNYYTAKFAYEEASSFEYVVKETPKAAVVTGTKWAHMTLRSKHEVSQNDYTEIKIQVPQQEGKRIFPPSHYPQPNIVTTLRGHNEDDTFFVNEMQADLHQAGAKYGYESQVRTEKYFEEANKIYNYITIREKSFKTLEIDDQERLMRHLFVLVNDYAKHGLSMDQSSVIESIYEFLDEFKELNIRKEVDRLVDLAKKAFKDKRAVADLPFKDNWKTLSLKRAVIEAVKRGKKGITWAATPEQIVKIERWPGVSKYKGSWYLTDGSNLSETEIENWMVERAENNAWEEVDELTPEQLVKHMGERVSGVVNTYLDWMPKAVKKQLKQYGGGTLTTKKLDGIDDPVNYFEFSPELVEIVSGKGLSLASQVPTDFDPNLDPRSEVKQELDKIFGPIIPKNAYAKTAQAIGKKSKDPKVKNFMNLTSRILFLSEPELIAFERKKNQQTTGILSRILSSPEYALRVDPAGSRVVDIALKQNDLKFTWEQEMASDHIEKMEALQKNKPSQYKAANKYLLDTDQRGKGFSVKMVEGEWSVMDRDNPELVRYIAKTERDAINRMLEAEQNWLKKNLYSQDVRDMVWDFRALTNKGFDFLAADLDRQIMVAKENSLKIPTVRHKDEKGESQEISLAEVRSLMGDLRGTYFPRERASRNYLLIAEHPNGSKKTLTFDAFLPGNVKRGALIEAMKKRINEATPMVRKARELEKQGYKVKIDISGTPADVLFDTPGLVAAVDKLMESVQKQMSDSQYKDANQAFMDAIHRNLAQKIADVYKTKGNFSSKKQRSEQLWEGYEEDALKTAASYTQRITAGAARRESARDMLLAFTGRDISFAALKKNSPNMTYKDYRKFVKQRGIDPSKQVNLYEDLRTYMRFVLKPDTTIDRTVGYLKAATVLWYLGGRISSALINTTNMVTGAPATIAAHGNVSLTRAWAEITAATVKYGAYRIQHMKKTGSLLDVPKSVLKMLTPDVKLSTEDKQIFDHITRMGWDEAQFNHEATRALQGTLGEAWDGVLSVAMYMFGATEKANRATTIFAAAKALKERHPEAYANDFNAYMEYAKHTSDRTHGVYGKAAKPWAIQQGKVGRLLDLPYTFKKFQHNYLLNAYEMGFRKGLTDKQTALRAMKNTTYMLFAPAVIAGSGAALPLQVLFWALKGEGDDPEEELYQWADETLGGDALIRNGISGALLGVNLKGSMQFDAPIPKTTFELTGAPGSVFMGLWEASEHFQRNEMSKGFEKALPTFMGSPLKGIREYTEGVTKKNYAPAFFGTTPLKATKGELAWRVLSFNPQRISGIREKQWHETEVRREYLKMRTDISAQYTKWITDSTRDEESYANIIADITEYNDLATSAHPRLMVPYITPKWLKSTVKSNLKPDKYERGRK